MDSCITESVRADVPSARWTYLASPAVWCPCCFARRATAASIKEISDPVSKSASYDRPIRREDAGGGDTLFECLGRPRGTGVISGPVFVSRRRVAIFSQDAIFTTLGAKALRVSFIVEARMPRLHHQQHSAQL